jgi:hypothetical protein
VFLLHGHHDAAKPLPMEFTAETTVKLFVFFLMLQQVNTTLGKVPPWKTYLHSKLLPMEFTAETTIK